MAKRTKEYLIEDTIIIDKIYPIVDSNIKNKLNQYKQCIGRFIHSKESILYDYAPINRVLFGKKEVNDFFRSTGINQKEVEEILPELYYWKKEELQACKDPFSLCNMMILRWLTINKPKDDKLIELCFMYLAFSGKFYASCHYQWFRVYIPTREVMDYVINYMLSQKFDLVKEKTVWGAIRNLTATWYAKYKDELAEKDVTDERIVYMIHQLHSRIYAFLRNIAKPYFEAYQKKLYLNKDSDNYDNEEFRLANNNSTVAASITEKTMTYFINSQVDLELCKGVSNQGVDPYDIKAIFENILNSNDNLVELRYVINIMIVDFMRSYPNEKEITGPKFIAHSVAMKPNSKDKDVLQSKAYILNWLNTSSRYNSIRTQTTRNNYYKAILGYIAFTINKVNKGA